jgi:hypothetical protein
MMLRPAEVAISAGYFSPIIGLLAKACNTVPNIRIYIYIYKAYTFCHAQLLDDFLFHTLEKEIL